MKTIKAEYIESGTFQGGESETYKAGIEYGEEVIIMKKSTFKEVKEAIAANKEMGVALELIAKHYRFVGRAGDLARHIISKGIQT